MEWLADEKATAREHLLSALDVAEERRTAEMSECHAARGSELRGKLLDELVLCWQASADEQGRAAEEERAMIRAIRAAKVALEHAARAFSEVFDRTHEPTAASVQSIRSEVAKLPSVTRLREDLLPAIGELEHLIRRMNEGRYLHLHFESKATSTPPRFRKFARLCLSYGLGPVEAAMIEAMHETSPRSANTKLYFDNPKGARDRWEKNFEEMLAAVDRMGPESEPSPEWSLLAAMRFGEGGGIRIGGHPEHVDVWHSYERGIVVYIADIAPTALTNAPIDYLEQVKGATLVEVRNVIERCPELDIRAMALKALEQQSIDFVFDGPTSQEARRLLSWQTQVVTDSGDSVGKGPASTPSSKGSGDHARKQKRGANGRTRGRRT